MRIGIILGYRLNDDNSRTARLDKRCDLAIEYYQKHGLDYLIEKTSCPPWPSTLFMIKG